MSQIGRAAIDFARRFMPALAAAQEEVRATGALDGRRVGIALTLEPKTACLVEAVAACGAQVAVLGSSHSTKGPVAGALAEAGLVVFAEPGASRDRMAELRDGFIDTRIQYLADDGAGIVRRIHTDRRDALEYLKGVAEETTSGVRPLRVMEAEGALEVPCVAVNDARSKMLFDNVYGTGQSVVMATLDVTNMQMAGSSVVVAGYGRVGTGIAAMARALGAKVTVAEVDPVAALIAHHDGLRVAPLAKAVADADFVFTASGIGHTLTAGHLEATKPGAIVAVGGAGPPELDLSGLTRGEEVRPGVISYSTVHGNRVYVVADGYCANTSAGEGNPIEIMDLSLALQLRALHYLASNELEPGVHRLPEEIDDAVARSQLTARGLAIDEPTPEQIRAATSWR
jgi:adenosylhomocysteinase